MKKSQSSPALKQQGMSAGITLSSPNVNLGHGNNLSLIKKSPSTTALNAMHIDNYEHSSFNQSQSSIDLVFLSTTPINKFVSCSIDYNKFPDGILNFKDDIGYVTCIETPPDPPPEPEEKINIATTLSKSYLQLSVESSEQQEKYMQWVRRIRRNRKNKNKSIIDKSIDLFQSLDLFQSMDASQSIDASISMDATLSIENETIEDKPENNKIDFKMCKI
jgi:hypothetical protein